MEALVVPHICEPLRRHSTLSAKWRHKHLKNLRLADPTRKEDSLQIDLLVGSDYYWSLVTGSIKKGKSGPAAIQTRVGWVLSGPANVPEDTSTANLLFTNTHLLRVQSTPADDRLDQQLQRFWDLETLGIQEKEQSVQDTFTQQIQFQNGRYQVTLPWKPTHRPLPTNLQLCKKRLAGLLKKLKTTPKLLTDYNNIIQDQLQQGVVEPVPEEEKSQASDRIHYLPHHAVVREDKTTTKVRVVFDVSAKSNQQPSLNDCLYAGPSFDQSIFQILLRFRLHPIAMTADMEKAFLMVSVAQEDRNSLRFLWIKDLTEDNQANIQPLRFTRVTFGVNSSPFLLNATIHHHISKYKDADPAFVKTFLSSIYVDDLSFGAQDEVSAYQLFSKAKIRLAEAGFNLRKFSRLTPKKEA